MFLDIIRKNTKKLTKLTTNNKWDKIFKANKNKFVIAWKLSVSESKGTSKTLHKRMKVSKSTKRQELIKNYRKVENK